MKKNVWLKSTRSGSTGTCTMCMRLNDGSTAVKDSKDPAGPVLVFTATQWQTFIDGVKTGYFDHS